MSRLLEAQSNVCDEALVIVITRSLFGIFVVAVDGDAVDLELFHALSGAMSAHFRLPSYSIARDLRGDRSDGGVGGVELSLTWSMR